MFGHNGFPTIKHIDDVLPYIEGRNDFAVKKGEGYTAIDYIFAGPDTFDEPIRRELRGIKFGADGKIIARPFHKFFNLGEKPETQSDAVNWAIPHVVLEKLDGSMVHPALVGGDVVWMTRAGVTDISRGADDFARKSGRFWRPCVSLLVSGITPIFEWCSPRNQIVILYPEDRLILTGMRDMVSGEYLPLSPDFEAILEYSTDIGDLPTFLAHTSNLKDAEGYVVRFNTGAMLKIKADDYVLKHKARDSVLLEKNVLRIVLEGKADDVIALLSAEDASRLEIYRMDVMTMIERCARQLDLLVAGSGGLDRKTFATTVVNGCLPIWKAPLFNIWQGTSAVEAVTRSLLKHCRSQTDIDSIRPFIGADWNNPIAQEAA